MDIQRQEEEDVVRSSKGLIRPASPTPSGILDLSTIDKLQVLRCNSRTLHVFKYGPAGVAEVIRKALAAALVPYYPLAGRLKFDHDDPFTSTIEGVDCNSQGVWFVEATAPNSTLESLNYFDDNHNLPLLSATLLPDHPPADDPLVLMQVTQYACGGFVMGLTFCHSMCDGLGAARFLQAVGEIAKGCQLNVAPVWHREFLDIKKQRRPKPVSDHQQLPQPPPIILDDDVKKLQHANIDIPLDDIMRLKRKFHDSTGLACSAFEIVAAMLWKNRTLSATTGNNDHKKQQAVVMKLVFFANCRGLVQPPLPQGFYGNCFYPMTITESNETLAGASLEDVVKLIQHAKTRLLPIVFNKWINEELEEAQNPFSAPDMGDKEVEDYYNTLFVSEWGRLGFNQVDYGWGPPIHVVPIQGSPMIPVAIVGSMPHPSKGIRLMTWCVHTPHLQPFLHHMMSSSVKLIT